MKKRKKTLKGEGICSLKERILLGSSPTSDTFGAEAYDDYSLIVLPMNISWVWPNLSSCAFFSFV